MTARRAVRLVEVVFAISVAVGFAWGLPGSDSWAADSISPRSCGLGAIVETYRTGHFHTYPPLHMALMTVVSFPWMAIAAARGGTGVDALAAELVKPVYMTGIEASARLVAAAMGIGILRATTALWSRIAGARAGVLAGAVVATNAVLVYYAHTGNLEVPYLFWCAWALSEIDRTLRGEKREMRALLFCAAAVLTKDQAAALLALPVAAMFVATRPRARLLRPALAAMGAYAIVSGAFVNPSGFAQRMAFLFGPASQTWARYPRGLGGAIALAGDAVRATTHFTVWPLAALAVAGVAIALHDRDARALLPLLAAVSFAVLFTFGARRSEDRFLLPQSVLVLPYAAVAVDRAWTAWPRARVAVGAMAAASAAWALTGVASVDATLLADPRYEAERFLARLPPGTRVELLGGPIFMPRIPPRLAALRPGVEPIANRQAIAGVEDVVDPEMDPRARAPDVIVLATELSCDAASRPAASPAPFALMTYRDERSRGLLRALADGSLGYDRVLRATCELPWPLECRRLHDSTAGEAWIYARRARAP